MRCNMCLYRDTLPDELTLKEISQLAGTLSALGLRHIVYSGGEPLLRKDFPEICRMFAQYNVKQTLLTNGLLLSKRFAEFQQFLNEIIVSIDGATAEVHNTIRGVESFDIILEGIREIVRPNHRPKISIRTVLQKPNFRALPEMIELAKSSGVDRISFLAVDVSSPAFGRTKLDLVESKETIVLSDEECVEFLELVNDVIVKYRDDFNRGFISEAPAKMFHIVQYFEALIGKVPYPRNYCNAPNVSAVIRANGDLLPCFFLPPFGNIKDMGVDKQLNNEIIRKIRQDVKNYSLQQCKTCVCTLSVHPFAALMNHF